MPTARVGAMPQPSRRKERHRTQDDHKRSADSSKQKGITMEDLKKQTAVRLAQEQNRRNATATREKNINSEDRGCHADWSKNKVPVKQEFYDHRSNRHYVEYREIPSDAMNKPIFRSQISRDGNHFKGTGHHHVSGHTTHARKNMNSSNSSSSMLPHGLTVQELKELTKARLAAEANNPKIKQTVSFEPPSKNGMYPTGLNDLSHRRRVHSHDITEEDFLRHRLNSHESIASAPPVISTNLSQSHHQDMRITSNQSFHDFSERMTQKNAQSNLTSRASWYASAHHNRPNIYNIHSDSLDNASVHSFNSAIGSDYIDSDNASLWRSSSTADDFSGVSISRSRSNPIGMTSDTFESDTCYNVDTMHYKHDTITAFNRCRNSTMSPSVLSDLFEDQPVIGDLPSQLSPQNGLSGGHLNVPSDSLDFLSTFNKDASKDLEFFPPSSDAPGSNQESSRFSFCFAPLRRNVSNGVSDVPNSVAESVLGFDESVEKEDSVHQTQYSTSVNDAGLLSNSESKVANSHQMTSQPKKSGFFSWGRSSSSPARTSSPDHSFTELQNDINKLLTVSDLPNTEVQESSLLSAKIDPEVRSRDYENPFRFGIVEGPSFAHDEPIIGSIHEESVNSKIYFDTEGSLRKSEDEENIISSATALPYSKNNKNVHRKKNAPKC